MSRSAQLAGSIYIPVMRLIGLTGGIGSGKSSASSRLAARGAVVIDADAIVRELQEPGQPVFTAMVERWGDQIVGEDGTLDRAAVAGIVFADADELAAINEIVHPAVRTETAARIKAAQGTDQTVILDNPLLIETIKKAEERAAEKARTDDGADNHKNDDDGEKAEGSTPIPPHIIVIDCPTDIAVERLMAHRGFERDDAEKRIAAQVSRDERLHYADFVVDNGGSEADLDAEIERCQAWIDTLPQA